MNRKWTTFMSFPLKFVWNWNIWHRLKRNKSEMYKWSVSPTNTCLLGISRLPKKHESRFQILGISHSSMQGKFEDNDQQKKDKSNCRQIVNKKLRSSNTNYTKKWHVLRCSRRISNSCSTSVTSRDTLDKNTVINHEYGKYGFVIT